MASETFTVNGPLEKVEAELRKVAGISSTQSLETVVKADGQRIPLTFHLSSAKDSEPFVLGMEVTTRRVNVSATSPTSLGFRQSTSPRAEREITERVRNIAEHLQKMWPEAASAMCTYEFSYNDGTRSFDMAYQDDVDAGCAPCEVVASDEINWREIRRLDGSKIGRLLGGSGYSSVRGELENVSPDEARKIGAAIRSWARGQALVDRPAFREKVL